MIKILIKSVRKLLWKSEDCEAMAVSVNNIFVIGGGGGDSLRGLALKFPPVGAIPNQFPPPSLPPPRRRQSAYTEQEKHTQR